MPTFSIKEALSKSWDVFVKNWMVLVGAVLITVILQNIPGFLVQRESLFVELISFVIGSFLMAGLVKIYFTTIDGGTPVVTTLFSEGKYFLNMLGAMFLSGVAIMIGLILLIIPGIYLSVRLMFVPFLVIDKNMNPIQALKESWKMTEGHLWHLFKLLLVFVLLVIVGAILLLVGLLVTVPIGMLSIAYVYRQLTKHAGAPVLEATPVAPVQ